MPVPRPLLPLLAIGCGWALAVGTVAAATPATLVALFAATTALVALGERRTDTAALAAGIAAAMAPAGLVILPILLGTAIARRRAGRTVGMLAAGLILLPIAGAWNPVTSDASLWSVAPPEAAALLGALAWGSAAWIAAACSARPPSRRELDEAALLAALALPLLAPVGIEAAGLGLALAMTGCRLSLTPIGMGANDNPPVLRYPQRPRPQRPRETVTLG